MEFDNPAVGGQWGGGGQWGSNQNSDSDFSGSEAGGNNSKKEKNILGSAKKKDKEKKKEKEKETKYAHLGDESSNDDDESGKKKKKAFKIGLAKKEKKEKKEKEAKEKENESKEQKELKEAKKKEKKEKPKLKLKKSKHTDSESERSGKAEETKWPPIFGVPLDLAVERNRCHDGVKLPVVVRQCIDFIEEQGLHVEGIYRSSGVKSKIVKLRTAYSQRQAVDLSSADPPVVASLLKLFLRELPDPVLTTKLMPSFEEVSKRKSPAQRLEGLRALLLELPEPNLRLVQWVFVHMGHVIQKEKVNKMTLQNVSIVLSPTMQISHRVLNSFFEHLTDLFSGVSLAPYVPPISGPSVKLPETLREIEEEMRKQESLLAELHEEISSGLVVAAREEQLWEQQRIVTQLKRNLRLAKVAEPACYEEELNFALQTPADIKGSAETTEPDKEAVKAEESKPDVKVSTDHTGSGTVASQPSILSSPDETASKSQEHRITVQIHQDQASKKDPAASDKVPEPVCESSPQPAAEAPSKSHVTVIQLNKSLEIEGKTDTPPHSSSSPKKQMNVSSTDASSDKQEVAEEAFVRENVIVANEEEKVKSGVSFSSTGLPPVRAPAAAAPSSIPLLPPPPPSSKTSSRAPPQRTLAPPDQRTKSRSLPRGLPSDGVFDRFGEEDEARQEALQEEARREALLLEEMRLKFEFEELLNLKSELERRKKTERREINELQEEIATMQTLYQYRTYSIDSSEESSGEEDEEKGQQQRQQRLELLDRLAAEKKQLEQKKLEMQAKLQEERAACLQLRVNIRMEQERIKRRTQQQNY